jgi:hypothetical protein
VRRDSTLLPDPGAENAADMAGAGSVVDNRRRLRRQSLLFGHDRAFDYGRIGETDMGKKSWYPVFARMCLNPQDDPAQVSPSHSCTPFGQPATSPGEWSAKKTRPDRPTNRVAAPSPTKNRRRTSSGFSAACSVPLGLAYCAGASQTSSGHPMSDCRGGRQGD